MARRLSMWGEIGSRRRRGGPRERVAVLRWQRGVDAPGAYLIEPTGLSARPAGPAFGYGIHQCLGQSLARAELQIALLTLLRRLPDLHITIPADEIKYPHGMATYGVHELPVGWW